MPPVFQFSNQGGEQTPPSSFHFTEVDICTKHSNKDKSLYDKEHLNAYLILLHRLVA